MSGQSHQNFTDFEVWKRAKVFKNKMFELTLTFPAEEKFRFSDQLIRASRSINSNIAEGQGYSYKDQIPFCIQARGSIGECLNHLIDAFDLHYITNEELLNYKVELDDIERLLNGYISFPRKNL